MSDGDFERILLETVDEGLSSLGESSKQAIYFHLEKTFNIKREDIPYKIKDFADATHKIFGLGASFLEILIMKRLHERIGGVFTWNESADFVFIEYIATVKRLFQEKEKARPTEELIECREEEIQI